jgi:hypothetical protein
MAIQIRKARRGDGRELTRIAHVAKRFWGYPEKWIQLWKPDLTITSDFIHDHHVYCAVRNSAIRRSESVSDGCSSTTSSVIFNG